MEARGGRGDLSNSGQTVPCPADSPVQPRPNFERSRVASSPVRAPGRGCHRRSARRPPRSSPARPGDSDLRFSHAELALHLSIGAGIGRAVSGKVTAAGEGGLAPRPGVLLIITWCQVHCVVLHSAPLFEFGRAVWRGDQGGVNTGLA